MNGENGPVNSADFERNKRNGENGPVLAPTGTAPGDETPALKTLMGQWKGPSLVLAEALQSHLKSYDQSLETLAQKLKTSRSVISQTLGLLDLEDDAKAALSGICLTYKEIQALNGLKDKKLQTTLCKELQENKIPAGGLVKRAIELNPMAANGQKNERNAGNAEKNERNGGNGPANGADLEKNERNGGNGPAPAPAGAQESAPRGHLIRRTVVTFAKFSYFWVALPDRFKNLEEVVDDWLDLLKRWFWGKRLVRTTLIALWSALAVSGVWHLKKDARDWAAEHWMSGGFGLVAHMVGLPAPQVSFAGFVPGHKFHLVWNPVGPGVTYQVLRVCGYEGRRSNSDFTNLDKPVSTPGAIVDLNHDYCASPAALAVRTKSADGRDSELSNIIQVAPDEDNNNYTVDPLPEAEAAVMTGPAAPAQTTGNRGAPHKPLPLKKGGGEGFSGTSTAGKIPPSPPLIKGGNNPANAPAPSAPLLNSNDVSQLGQAFVPQTGGLAQRVGNAIAMIAGKTVTAGSPTGKKLAPGPQNLRWHPHPGDASLVIEWDPMPGYHYNLYAAPYGPTPSFDLDVPMLHGSAALWTPPPQSPRIYLFYVTAVNSQGEESAPSQRLLADNR